MGTSPALWVRGCPTRTETPSDALRSLKPLPCPGIFSWVFIPQARTCSPGHLDPTTTKGPLQQLQPGSEMAASGWASGTTPKKTSKHPADPCYHHTAVQRVHNQACRITAVWRRGPTTTREHGKQPAKYHTAVWVASTDALPRTPSFPFPLRYCTLSCRSESQTGTASAACFGVDCTAQFSRPPHGSAEQPPWIPVKVLASLV